VDARLHISGVRGVWAYLGHVEYGRAQWIQVVPWHDAMWQVALGWYEAPLERMFVLADRTEEGAR